MLDGLIKDEWGVEPNMCHTVYKNRGNRHKDIRIWTKINLGNVREEVLFVTDGRYRLIPMEEIRTNNLTTEQTEVERERFNKILTALKVAQGA